MSRLKRRTHWRKLVGWRELGMRLFPVDKAEILAKVRTKVKEEKKFQENGQKIGDIIEEKVFNALQSLEEKKGEIKGFFQTEQLDYADLMEGVDFVFWYVDGRYEKLRDFSVTGKHWVQKHLQKHPEVPVLAIGLLESQKSIEQKILALKNAEKNAELKKK